MTDKTNTPDEIVDVVDESDNIIGQNTKGVVNSDPKLIHREISVLIYDDEGRILTQQRSRKKHTHPLYWIISVAGHIPSGMDALSAAHKELQEELGFNTELKLYEKVLLKYPNETHFCYSYVGKIPKDSEIKIDPAETEAIKFIGEKELTKMIKSEEKIEEYSLQDFKKYFSGQLNL